MSTPEFLNSETGSAKILVYTKLMIEDDDLAQRRFNRYINVHLINTTVVSLDLNN